MTCTLRTTILCALAVLAPASHAEDALRQTTISFYAAGKPVGSLIFPIGTKAELSAVANQVDANDAHTRLTGNMQGRFTTQAGQTLTLVGDDVQLTSEPISAERAQAVRDLEAMDGPDQLYRGKSTTGKLTPEEWKLQGAIDNANMKRLAQIIDTYGWPGVRFAGAASQTAFLVLQHADGASQRKYLPQLRAAVERKDALGSSLAMLEDRVRVADGKRQLYGTQLKTDPLRFDPIEDEAHLEERRRSVGLPPMKEYAAMFGLTYTPRHLD